MREGYGGIKPGWCRIGFHYAMDTAEVDYIIEAVEFLAEHGHLFLALYDFDIGTGAWQHKQEKGLNDCLSIACALSISQTEPHSLAAATRVDYYRKNLDTAAQLAAQLAESTNEETCSRQLEGKLAELQFFDF